MSSSAGESDRESSLEESESSATERASNSQEENQNRQNYAQMKRMKELQEAGPRLSVREQLAANRRENELKNKAKANNTTPRASIKPSSSQRNSVSLPNVMSKNNISKPSPRRSLQPQRHLDNKTEEMESDRSSEKGEDQIYQSKRRIQHPPQKRQSLPAKITARPPMSFAKRDSSKGIPVDPKGAMKVKPGTEKAVERVLKDDTFGDMERKLVKQFREDHNSVEKPEDSDLVEFYRKLADIYYQSGMDTENIYNILRATGLLNLCLSLVNDDDNRGDDLEKTLVEIELSALKRVIKLKPNEAALFHNNQHHNNWLDEMGVMRDVYEADFNLLLSCINELPDMQAILDTGTLSNKQLLAEDKIIAITSLMVAETFERKKRILTSIFNDSIAILGPLPCSYALTSHYPSLSTVNSYSFGAMNLFLLIEKDSAAIRSYFRNLLSVIAMQMVDLGETALSDLNIRSLHWMKSELAQSSGFALLAFMDDVDKKNLPKIFVERLRSPVDLLCSATSNKVSERDDVYEVSDGPKFVCGDPRLFKELMTVRQTVVQREQADVDFKEKMLSELQSLVLALDPFDNVTLSAEYEDMIQRDVLDLPEKLLMVLFGLEKNLVSDEPKTRLEEMMQINYVPLNAVMSFMTEVCDGVIETRFTDDTDNLESPRALNQIQGRLKPFSVHWWQEPESGNFQNSPRNSHSKDETTWNTPRDIDDRKLLRELKLKKRESVQGSNYDGGHPTGSVNTTKRAINQNRNIDDDTENGNDDSSVGFSTKSYGKAKKSPQAEPLHPVSQVRRAPIPPPVNPEVVKPKNASDRVRVKEKPKRAKSPSLYKKKPPVVEPFKRLITSIPVHIGKPKDVLKGETVHNLTLLHSLTTVIKQSQADPLIITDHQAPQLDKKVLNAMYLKVLQIILPLIEHLRPLVKSSKSVSVLKKALYSMDLSPIDNELAVALACFHSMKYQRACKAVYSYLENRSDITFIGEPFPCDLTEVCQELLDDQEITKERYESIHTLLAHCNMRRENYDEAVSYWNELLSLISDTEKLAQIHTNLATCSVQLEKWPDAINAIDCAIEKYKSLPRSNQKAKKMLIKLKEMRTEVEGLHEMKSELSSKKSKS